MLWNGDDNNGRSITGVGFKPDLVWIKKRNGINDHNLFDIIRGPNLALFSSNVNGDTSYTDRLFSFDGNGFTIGSSTAINQSSRDFVAWCWKAGGEAVTNTDGSITSQVSVNQDAGFSIVSYTGNGINDGTPTVGHGLGKAPSMTIIKNRDSAVNWDVHLFGTVRLSLNLTEEDQNNNQCQYTNTTFSLANNSQNRNGNGTDYIAYCWAEIEGFSKFGSYVGNASADGAFVYCGFKPAWVMFKRSSSTSSWVIWDTSRSPTNPLELSLAPDTSNVEDSTPGRLDFVSNGFKMRSSSFPNDSNTFIFAAFAESPFKYANSK